MRNEEKTQKKKRKMRGKRKISTTLKKANFRNSCDVFVEEFFPGYKLENEGRYSWAILLKSGGRGRVQFRQSCVNSNFSETSYEGKRNLRPMTGNLSL